MSLNLLLNYDKSFFNIFKKSILMNINIIDSFCKSDKRKIIRKDENKINYIFSYLSSHLSKHLKYYTNYQI